MPWTQDFPVLSDDHVSTYETDATPAEKEQLQRMFSHCCLGGASPEKKHLIAFSLSPHIPYPDLLIAPPAVPSRNLPPPATDNFTKEQIVSEIYAASRSLALNQPDAAFRIYLDPAWQDLSSFLMDAGCEVMLMDHPSEGPNPAKLWRYLALQEERMTVTFIGLHEISHSDNFLNRVIALSATGLKIWRMPMDRRLRYRPIHPNRFGSAQSYPALDLLASYIWYIKLQAGKNEFSPPLIEPPPLAATQPPLDSINRPIWERGNLEEFFLLTAFYPRAAFDGILSVIEVDDAHSRWLTLDIEYATWANPDSEIIFVHPEPARLRTEESRDGYITKALVERLFHANRYPEFLASEMMRISEPEPAVDSPAFSE